MDRHRVAMHIKKADCKFWPSPDDTVVSTLSTPENQWLCIYNQRNKMKVIDDRLYGRFQHKYGAMVHVQTINTGERYIIRLENIDTITIE